MNPFAPTTEEIPMQRRRCPGCREYAEVGIRCRACGHRFCTAACLEEHRQGYHGLPPRDPPLWFNALTYLFLFAAACVVGLVLVAGSVLRDPDPRLAAPPKSPDGSAKR
jgi:hypothetical protein